MGRWIFGREKRKEIEEKKEERDSVLAKSVEANVTLAVNSQTVARHADAASEFVKAYTGRNNQAGGALKQDMQKSLKGISEGKINPNYADSNRKQQAGYAAEVMDVAKRNAEEKLKGSDKRYARADDVNGHKINETKHDIILIDKGGNEILGPDGQSQGVQMKFVKMGKSPEETASALTSSKFRNKYPDGEYCVAKDKYEGVKTALQDKEAKLQGQIDRANQKGDTALAAKKQEELEYTQKVREKLVASKNTEEEVLATVDNPLKWSAGEIAKMSHDAGVDCAKSAATITFVSSFARNLSGYLKGDIDEETALKNLAKDTTKAAAGAYVTGAVSTAISATLMESSNQMVSNFVTQHPNSPAYVVSFLTQSFSIIGKRMKGEITDEQCFREIGKTALVMGGSIAGKALGTAAGTAMGKAVGGTLGAALGPVGAMVGSFIGSVVVSAAVDVIGRELDAIKRANVLLHAQRERLEEAKSRYESLCKELDEYDRIFRETYMRHTEELRSVLGDSIRGMAYALHMKDADSFIVQTNQITGAFGQTAQFNSVSEFKTMVKNRVPLDL